VPCSKITNSAFCYDIDFHNFTLFNSSLFTCCMFGKVLNVLLVALHISSEFHFQIHTLWIFQKELYNATFPELGTEVILAVGENWNSS